MIPPTPDERMVDLLMEDDADEWRRWSRHELTAWPPEALASFGAGIPALELAVAEHGLSAGGTALQQPRRLAHAAAVGQRAADAIDLELTACKVVGGG